MWEREFKAQDYGRIVQKYSEYPVYITDEFNFFRCVEFNDAFYGKTVSELHNGNLRFAQGRYSVLFPNQKVSYWANSIETAKAEIRSHGAKNDILSFWAYDDATSIYPTIEPQEPLVIMDGRKCGIQDLIDKVDSGKEIKPSELEYLNDILDIHPDCLVYDSHALEGGENYIFLEKGFRKLALRQVGLYLGSKNRNRNIIVCADTCDYRAFVESYGECFMPIAKVKTNKSYLSSEEYRMRFAVYQESLRRFQKEYWRK